MNLGQSFVSLWERLSTDVGFAVTFGISIVAFAFLYYYITKFLLKNNSGQLILVLVAAAVILGGVLLFNPNISNGLFMVVPLLMVVIVICLYSVEIKRLVWAKKDVKLASVKHDGSFYDEEKINTCITEIVKALQDMSKTDTGAIIVLSSGNIPSQILDSGVRLDSDISSALIESVFFPKTPLHDGAMIISGTKVVAAGCFLPLSQQVDKIPKDLGTRHRAGLGITENIDVVSLIVSEETGIITIAKAGKITRYADSQALKKVLVDYYWQELSSVRRK
ncbi:MAG: DNA integrity scanning protein DisA nucleotide-binding domain protein [Clostridia bacterium]|nr:DNA integrity scanning protein DisA nucleotide-binding domain protein [Clostridia bacterium]